ncbi:hypothetical protein N7U66_13445 [Lacinutrix neustonica]|uniref:Uncharacterized protein n=1 Tax=Lacinutrix neustonica TaxID=2980107 RepID=A0A9E8MVP4_9FLAO|nr:hypothetical protein [Lacinutrix neustonica]WAC01155.1 hypothetical protein N7U66_13445 [Lacinutrix neustonica]
MHFLTRPHKAYKKAKVVILATPSGREIVSKYTKKESIILPETGAHKVPMSLKTYRDKEKLVLVWLA